MSRLQRHVDGPPTSGCSRLRKPPASPSTCPRRSPLSPLSPLLTGLPLAGWLPVCLLLMGWLRTGLLRMGLLGAAVVLTCAAGRAQEPAKPPPADNRDFGNGNGNGQPVAIEPAAIEPAAVDGELQRAVEDHAKALQPPIEASLRSALHAELYFIHLVCGTDRQQRQQLARAAEQLLPQVAAEAALQAARSQRAGNPVGRMLNAGLVLPEAAADDDPPQPLQRFQQRLVSLATEQLGPEHGERLQQELQHRVEVQRRATIANIINQLDAFLVLTPQQQEDLVQPLLNGWQESWRTIPQYIQPQYMPQMQLPAAALQQLSDAQRGRWQSLPKVRILHHDQPDAPGAQRWQQVLEQLDRDEAGEAGPPPPAQEPRE